MEASLTEALTKITAEIVSAYVSNNNLHTQELTGLIKDVHGKLAELTAAKAEAPAEAKPEPPVPIRKTITPGYLVSLEDGKHYKTLRRHLSKRGLTPDAYRAKWGLPADYPMVARDYAERRSALAKSMGLGRKPTDAEPSTQAEAIADDLVDVIAEDTIGDELTQPASATAATEAPTPKKRGRPAKAERMVTPHLKPKDRAKAKRAATMVEGNKA